MNDWENPLIAIFSVYDDDDDTHNLRHFYPNYYWYKYPANYSTHSFIINFNTLYGLSFLMQLSSPFFLRLNCLMKEKTFLIIHLLMHFLRNKNLNSFTWMLAASTGCNINHLRKYLTLNAVINHCMRASYYHSILFVYEIFVLSTS